MMKCTKSTNAKRSAAIRNGLIALAGMVAVFGSGALFRETKRGLERARAGVAVALEPIRSPE